jgi:hypothetical protein
MRAVAQTADYLIDSFNDPAAAIKYLEKKVDLLWWTSACRDQWF